MRIPKQINVLGKKWLIKYKWNLSDEEIKCDGLCCYRSRTIFIDRSLPKVDRPQTFLHELLHAIIYEAKLHNADSFTVEVEEIMVETISSYIMDKFSMRLKRK